MTRHGRGALPSPNKFNRYLAYHFPVLDIGFVRTVVAIGDRLVGDLSRNQHLGPVLGDSTRGGRRQHAQLAGIGAGDLIPMLASDEARLHQRALLLSARVVGRTQVVEPAPART